MTITKIPFQHQLCVFSYLNERDLHFVWRSSKTLQPAAGCDPLWKPFLEKRYIVPTDHAKQRLTAFFKKSCRSFLYTFGEDYRRAKIEHIAGQKRRQFLMDIASQPKSDVVILSRARTEEMGWNYIDVYDLYSSIFTGGIGSYGYRSKELHQSLYHIGSSLQDTRDPDHVRFLLEFKPDLKSKYNINPLAAAISNSHFLDDPAIIKMLIDAKADIDLPITLGIPIRLDDEFCKVEGLLNYALAYNILRPSLQSEYLKHGVSLQRIVSPELVRILLEAGARPTKTVVKDGRRFLGSLHAAVWLNLSHEILQLLVKAGATRTMARANWTGTLELAKMNGYSEVSIRLLEEADEEMFEIPAAEAVAQAPVLNPPDLPDIQIEPPAGEQPAFVAIEPIEQPMLAAVIEVPAAPVVQPQEEPSLLEQLLPRWLWRILQPIGQFIRSLFSRIARGV